MSDENNSNGTESKSVFRLIITILIFLAIIMLIGIIGFRYIYKLDWIDCLHNTAFYAAGVGPVAEANTTGEKLFASFYALLAGLIFIGIAVYIIDKIVDIEFFNQ